MKRARRTRLQLTGWMLAVGVAMLVSLPGTVLAQPTKTTNCVTNGCHIQLIATAGVGMIWGAKVVDPASSSTTSPATVTVTAGSSFELDVIANKITYAAGNTGMSFIVGLPTGWTVNAQGTTTGANPAGWKTVWDQTGGSSWRTGTVLALPAGTFPGGSNGYSIDWTGNANWAVSTGAAYDNGLNATPGDKDLVADQMGVDVVVNVPAGTTAGNYSIYMIGIGHDASKKGYYSQLITVTVQAAAGDTTKPTVTAFTATTPRNSNVAIPITTFTATDNTAVTGYIVTESATAPLAGAAGWTASAPATYTAAAGDGTKTLYPWAKDAAGNVSLVYATPASVVVDSTAPTTTHNAPATWQNANVTVTLTPTDGTGTGVASTQYCVDLTNTCVPGTAGTSVLVSQTAGTAGTQYVRFASTDNIGNVETVKSATVMIDKSSPTDGTLTVTPGNGQNALSWTAASDTGSDLHATSAYKVVYAAGAVAPANCSSGTQIYLGTALSYPHTSLTNGTQYSYRVCAYDAVGNVSAGATGSGTPVAGNTAPNAPSALAQYKSDGTTVVTAGTFTNSSSPVMKVTITDPDANTVQLEVEIQPIASPFTNTPNCASGAMVASGTTASATCGPLTDGRYKWQARGKDSVGATGAWTQY